MPITFQKSALINAAKQAIAGHERAEVEWEAAKAKYRIDNASEVDLLPQIKALRDELTTFLKSKRQPTKEDAQRFRRVIGEDYVRNLYVPEVQDRDVDQAVPRPSNWIYRNKVESFRGLVSMLEANQEETITAAQLKLFGYTDLEVLFRRAAEEQGAVTG